MSNLVNFFDPLMQRALALTYVYRVPRHDVNQLLKPLQDLLSLDFSDNGVNDVRDRLVRGCSKFQEGLKKRWESESTLKFADIKCESFVESLASGLNQNEGSADASKVRIVWNTRKESPVYYVYLAAMRAVVSHLQMASAILEAAVESVEKPAISQDARMMDLYFNFHRVVLMQESGIVPVKFENAIRDLSKTKELWDRFVEAMKRSNGMVGLTRIRDLWDLGSLAFLNQIVHHHIHDVSEKSIEKVETLSAELDSLKKSLDGYAGSADISGFGLREICLVTFYHGKILQHAFFSGIGYEVSRLEVMSRSAKDALLILKNIYEKWTSEKEKLNENEQDLWKVIIPSRIPNDAEPGKEDVFENKITEAVIQKRTLKVMVAALEILIKEGSDIK